MITLVSFISPYKKDRDGVRALVDKGDFIEVRKGRERAKMDRMDVGDAISMNACMRLID